MNAFSLDLEAALPETDSTPSRFRLSSDAARETPVSTDGASRGLTLSRSAHDRERQEAFEDFFDRLEVDRWPDGVGRREHRLAGEQMRVAEGGLLGFPGGSALMLAPREIPELAKKLFGALSGSAPRQSGASTSLRVVNRRGSAPSMIAVVPAVGRTVGELQLVGCHGKCVIPGSIVRPATLLIVEDGAAVVRLEGPPGETPVQLKHAGVLRLKPPATNGRLRVRVFDTETKIKVPIAKWKNPGGSEWVTVSPTGLSLQLPEGSYTIEISSADGEARQLHTTVVGGATTTTPLR